MNLALISAMALTLTARAVPAECGALQVNGAKLAYEVAGRGPATVLIHAGVADMSMWDEPFAAPTPGETSVFDKIEALYGKKDFEKAAELESAVWGSGPEQRADRAPAVLRERLRKMILHNNRTHTTEPKPIPLNLPAATRLSEFAEPPSPRRTRAKYPPDTEWGHLALPGEVTRGGEYVVDPASGKAQPGQLVIYWLELSSGVGHVPVLLTTDHGLMVINESNAESKSPKPLFLLADRKSKRVGVYRTFEQLHVALAALPRGSKVYAYDRCTSSASAGLPGSTWSSIRRSCRASHIRLIGGYRNEDRLPILTCICGPG